YKQSHHYVEYISYPHYSRFGKKHLLFKWPSSKKSFIIDSNPLVVSLSEMLQFRMSGHILCFIKMNIQPIGMDYLPMGANSPYQ
ncbi:MAG: hypothetical protein M3342_21840, partial [Bacteroidota bacterium]|nr:hypothetical protein [Bacteroidota bacterium]